MKCSIDRDNDLAVDYKPPHPTHPIRRPRNVLTDPPDALTAAVIDPSSLLHPAAANRLRRQEGRNRPVTVSCDILCRDDFHQASSIAHVTRRRHSHVPSGRTRDNKDSTLNIHGHYLEAIVVGRDTNKGKESMISDERSGTAISIRSVVPKTNKTRQSKATARSQHYVTHSNNGEEVFL
ncbi:hypothetical protein EVAR_6506_1 [Eumeta japonica]|uniref:Uncharacterized protein n=1 Tax=Eumeta variegata TaxID=151549 RepID=A0A4C1SSH8_EUMVA|nr:hypothetical protein EVAR_6506_1 [Eumeta japonica]